MELKNMSKESLEQILTSLLSGGHITVESIEAALQFNPTNEVKREVDMLHTFLCEADHQEECTYYNEECAVDEVPIWQKPAHQHWVEKTYLAKKAYNISDLGALPQLIREVERLLTGSPYRLLILDILTVIARKERKIEATRAEIQLVPPTDSSAPS